MQMTGEYRISAPRTAVWEALNDPNVLRRCIPGCETVEKTSDTSFAARVALSVGPVKAKFNGKVTLTDLDPPNGYTISGEGQGGVAGFGKGSAKVRLEEEPGPITILRYDAQAAVGGKLAQVGSRLIDATAKKLADEFFSRFAATVAPAPGPAAPPPAPAAETPVTLEPGLLTPTEAAVTAATDASRRRRLSPAIWIPALIAAIALLLWIVTRR